MPAVAQIDIEKTAFDQTFTNRYLVNILPDEPTSGALIAALVAAEKLLAGDQVFFTRARHASLAPNDQDFAIVPLTGTGARAIAAGTYLPLFNVIRVDFLAGFGRPSRKYLRGCLGEADQDNGNVNPTLLSNTVQSYVQAVTSRTEVVDPQGDDLISGIGHPKVGMRQLRRGSRRQSEPVL